MGPKPNDIAVLTTARTEFEARAIALALQAEGIHAQVFGGIPGDGFAPIKVLVRQSELAVAALALEVIRLEAATLDWSAVEEGTDGNTADEQRAVWPEGAADKREVPWGRACGYRGPATSSAGGIALLATKDTLLAALPPDIRAAPGALLLATGVIWGCAAARRARRSR